MHAVRVRTVAIAIGLISLICVVAIAGRQPLQATTEETAGVRRAPEDAKRGVPPPRGPQPPEVVVLYPDEAPATPAWLAWTIVALGVVGIVTAGLVLVRDLRVGGAQRRRRRKDGRTAPGATA